MCRVWRLHIGALMLVLSLTNVAIASVVRNNPLSSLVKRQRGAVRDDVIGSRTVDDSQNTLSLDPASLATGFFSDGLANAAPGQVASMTSKNNFINFCKSHPDKSITNGLQTKVGSCNPAPMGILASSTNIPSCKFQFPANLDQIPAFTTFLVKLRVNNMQLGSWVNPQTNFLAAPQTINSQGNIVGQAYIVIEAVDSLISTRVSDPTIFAFFAPVTTAQDSNNVVTVPVPAGLPDGFYKMTSILTTSNHMPVGVAIHVHGSTEDAVYFTVGSGGADVAGQDAVAQAAAAALATFLDAQTSSTVDSSTSAPTSTSIVASPARTAGSQFITGNCSADTDCATLCCGFGSGKCAAAVVAQDRDGGCGFGDIAPNNIAVLALGSDAAAAGVDNSKAGQRARDGAAATASGSGKAAGTQFITGECANDVECASTCCSAGRCANHVTATSLGGKGCGFDAAPARRLTRASKINRLI